MKDIGYHGKGVLNTFPKEVVLDGQPPKGPKIHSECPQSQYYLQNGMKTLFAFLSLILSWVYSFPEAMWYAVSQKITSEKANIRLQPPSSKPDVKQICKNGKLSLSSH